MFDSISQYIGWWLRTNEINGLVYPSARTNAAVKILNGETIEDHRGWNLVDYRDAPVGGIVDVMVNVSVGSPPPLPAGVSIVLPPPDAPELRGSFVVRGLQEWHVDRLNRTDGHGVLDPA